MFSMTIYHKINKWIAICNLLYNFKKMNNQNQFKFTTGVLGYPILFVLIIWKSNPICQYYKDLYKRKIP